MNLTHKAIAIAVLAAFVLAPGLAQAGMAGDPHAVGFGSPAWWTAPRQTQGGQGIDDPTLDTLGSGDATADVYLLDGNPLEGEVVGNGFGGFWEPGSLFQNDTLGAGVATFEEVLVGGGVAEADNWEGLDISEMLSGSGTHGSDVPGDDQAGRRHRRRRHRRHHEPPQDPTNPVPEPATMLLLATGLGTAAAYRKFAPHFADPSDEVDE